MFKLSTYLFLTMTALPFPCAAQTTVVAGIVNSTIDDTIASFRVTEFGSYNALRDMAKKTNVVVGFDEVEPNHENTLTIDFSGGTVADLFNQFVRIFPEFSWEQSNTGAIHVIRKGLSVSLVDVVMAYPGAVQKTREQIWADLTERPEVSTWMKQNQCVRSELFNGKEFENYNQLISIEAGSLTVASLLDQIAAKSGVKYWAVLRSPLDKPCKINILVW